MEEQLISFETAKLAKEKGFYHKNGGMFDKVFTEDGEEYNCLSVPYHKSFQETYNRTTQSLLQKWLREKHNLSICVDLRETTTHKIDGINNVYYDVNIYYLTGGDAWKKVRMSEISSNYEEALEKGLQEALEFIKT